MKTQPNPHLAGVEDVEPSSIVTSNPDLYLIDVRREDEWRGPLGHIVEAKWVLLDTLPERLNEVPTDKTVIFVCHSGGRSGQAAKFCQAQGFRQVYNLQGGMLLWNQLGLPVTKES